MDALLLFIIIFGFVIMLAISVYLLIVYVHRSFQITQPMTRDGGQLSIVRFSSCWASSCSGRNHCSFLST